MDQDHAAPAPPAPAGAAARISTRPEVIVVSWRGEGDLLDVVLLRAIAQEIAAMPDRCPVVIDMSAVTTMDSITLGQLLGLLRRLRAAGRQLRLAGVQPGVQRGFDLMGLRRALSFDPDVTSSLAAIPGIVTAT